MNATKLMIAAAAFAALNANAALTFSEGAAGSYGGPIAFTSANGQVSAPSGSVANVYLAPLTLGATDPYSVITTGGVATIDFAGAGVASFSFLWGSPDTYNFLDIATNDGPLVTFGGADLGVLSNPDFLANGNNANTRLFTIGTNDGTLIDSITFRSDGIAFEVAAAIPEPSTYALMIAGLAAVGFVARRRKG